MSVIDELEREQAAEIAEKRAIPEFAPGDTMRVNVKVVEGQRERIQAYEGVCIARSGAGLNESFTVRKISYGEGVERVFPIYSPLVASIEVLRRGRVRRAKLYYLRGLRGKSARIAERQDAAYKASKAEAAAAKKSPAKTKQPETKDKAEKKAAGKSDTKAAKKAEPKGAQKKATSKSGDKKD